MKDAVEQVLKNIEKSLKLHNGGLELHNLDLAKGEVTIGFTGACATCSLSNVTFVQGVERALFLGVPGLKKVILQQT